MRTSIENRKLREIIGEIFARKPDIKISILDGYANNGSTSSQARTKKGRREFDKYSLDETNSNKTREVHTLQNGNAVDAAC